MRARRSAAGRGAGCRSAGSACRDLRAPDRVHHLDQVVVLDVRLEQHRRVVGVRVVALQRQRELRTASPGRTRRSRSGSWRSAVLPLVSSSPCLRTITSSRNVGARDRRARRARQVELEDRDAREHRGHQQERDQHREDVDHRHEQELGRLAYRVARTSCACPSPYRCAACAKRAAAVRASVAR